jgi:NAD+-dependent protein deacetylase sirtuin 4
MTEGSNESQTEAAAADAAPTSAPRSDGIDALARLLTAGRIVVLSGAGVSTESGIPDYRGPSSRARPPRPIKYHEFVGSAEARARYWARSAVGWPRISASLPNKGHSAIARLERAGIVLGVITQNVDGLHQAAGSKAVIELHGSLASAVCLSCGTREARAALQDRIMAMNREWAVDAARLAASAPDGDAAVDAALIASFHVPVCLRCGGILKPDVVLFGENVPKARVDEAFDVLGRGEVLLVVGSSLATYSGLRFVTRAVEEGKLVAIVNRGPTRADAVAAIRIDAALGGALPALATRLVG